MTLLLAVMLLLPLPVPLSVMLLLLLLLLPALTGVPVRVNSAMLVQASPAVRSSTKRNVSNFLRPAAADDDDDDDDFRPGTTAGRGKVCERTLGNRQTTLFARCSTCLMASPHEAGHMRKDN